MYTGRQTLTSIDNTLQEVRGQVQAVEDRMQNTTVDLLQHEQSEAEQYRALARLRVNLLAAGEIVQTLDDSERRALQLLQARERALAELTAEVDASGNRRAELEASRDARAQQVDEAEEILDKAEAATQQGLQQDAAYQAQLEMSHQTERTAKHAEEKTQLAQQDRVAKGKPYEDDPLFMYLWKRGYGTSRYHANPLIRFLDRQVARLCRYEDARANYHMLLEIPQRLQKHAGDVRTGADQAFAALEALEQAAADADGIPALQEQLDQEENALGELDEQLAAHQKTHQELLQRKAAFAAGEDQYFRQAVELMAVELRRDGIMTLHRDAELTPMPQDDLIVEQLATLGRGRQQIEDTLEQQRGLLKGYHKRLNDLESIRLDFRRHRYDGNQSVFSDGSMVALMLSQFLNGMLSRDGLWREIERQQQTRVTHSNPTFGTRGFGRRGSVWRSGGRGGFGGGAGRGSFGGGGGGFRTGGGF